MNQVVIGVGSNIAPHENIPKAKNLIQSRHSFLAQSSFRQTKPIGYTAQADFINGAFLVETDQDSPSFRAFLKEVEKKLGREQLSHKFGPRTIDLDVVVWNGEIMDSDFYKRDFLREAVFELLPGLKGKG